MSDYCQAELRLPKACRYLSMTHYHLLLILLFWPLSINLFIFNWSKNHRKNKDSAKHQDREMSFLDCWDFFKEKIVAVGLKFIYTL